MKFLNQDTVCLWRIVVTPKMGIKNATTLKIIKKMIKNEKEMNADIIWNHLKKNCGSSTKELRKQLKMNDKEFLIALNWLSREKMIVFYAKEKIKHV